jgi:DNA-binding protein YbaB
MANLPSFTSLLGAMNALERSVSDFEYGLASTTAQSSSSDGTVMVVANGLGRIVSVTINPSLVSPGDPVSLASTVMTVANAAIAAAITQASALAVTFATSLGLPGLPAYGGPAPTFTGFGPTASLVSATALANNPCQQARQFQCQSGPVLATVDADRRIVALVFDSPLPEFVETLQSSAMAAINCAVAKSTNPPDDVHNGTGGIVGTTTGFGTLVVYSNSELELDAGAQVKGTSCQGYGQIGNTGTGQVTITLGADVGNVLSRGDVIVGGHVHGSVTTEGKVVVLPGGVIDGTTSQNHAVVLPILKVGVVFPATAQNPITLNPLQQSSAAPAYYRSIFLNAGATLTVTAGVYYTDSLDLELGSKIVVDATNGPVIFWVKNTFVFHGAFQDKAGVFPRIWVGYIGALQTILTSAYQGSLVAPNAVVTLAAASGTTHTGSFHAKEVEVGISQTVCFRPFELPFNAIPGARPPDPPPGPIGPQTAAVLGFEDATAWTSTQATLALATTPITQGASALKCSNIQAITAAVVSRAFSAVGIESPAGQFLIDVFIPKAQGQIDIQAKVPSAGILLAPFGIQSIASLPANRYSTLTYTIPSNVLAALASGAPDVTLTVVFSLPSNAGIFYLDNIRFA